MNNLSFRCTQTCFFFPNSEINLQNCACDGLFYPSSTDRQADTDLYSFNTYNALLNFVFLAGFFQYTRYVIILGTLSFVKL